uniref:Uncharacterized protein n=1 Tax=Picea sitchensis TaxID=3332 RepID=A9P1A3_PICSI|nr:unknown [Picea sitchensis]
MNLGNTLTKFRLSRIFNMLIRVGKTKDKMLEGRPRLLLLLSMTKREYEK